MAIPLQVQVKQALDTAIKTAPKPIGAVLSQLIEDRKTKFAALPFLVLIEVKGTSLDNATVVAEARMPGVPTVQSFADARPRGVSGHWYEDDDQFTAADMLRHLTFERGKLHLYVDYLRGRCVKTTVEISSDGRVRLDTVNRGQAATRWVDRIKGKSFLKPVEVA